MTLRSRVIYVVAGVATVVLATPTFGRLVWDHARDNDAGEMALPLMLVFGVAIGATLVGIGLWPEGFLRRRRIKIWWLLGGAVLTLVSVSSLTGEWLPAPPWWTYRDDDIDLNNPERPTHEWFERYQPTPGREWISGVAAALGVAMMWNGVRRTRSWDESRPEGGDPRRRRRRSGRLTDVFE